MNHDLDSARNAGRDRSNRWYTAVVIGGGGAIGSGITVLFVCGIVWGLFLAARREFEVRAPRPVLWIAGAFALYFLAEFISMVVNEPTPRGIIGSIENLPFLAVILVFSRLAFSTREALEDWVEIGAVAGAFAAAIFAVCQVVFLDFPRATGLAGNPGPFAVVCAVLYGLCIMSAVRRRERRRILVIFGALAAAAALMLSGMRTLWPVILFAPFIPVVAMGSRWTVRRLAVYTAVSLALVAIVGALTFSALENRIGALESDLALLERGDLDSSLGQRLLMWQIGVDLVQERPIFGYGPKSVSATLAAHTADSEVTIQYSHMHNFLLNAQVRSGILGLIAVLGLLLVPAAVGWHGRNRDGTAQFGFGMMLVLAFAYVCSGMLNVNFGHDILDTLYIYGTIVASYLVFGEPMAAGEARDDGAREAAILAGMTVHAGDDRRHGI
ncbi:MAG: O-antigen ligase family protein [Aliihoeflea sp.]